MVGLLILAGTSALGYKLGMDAGRLKDEGKNDGEVLMKLPGLALGHVSNAFKMTYDTVKGLVTGDAGKSSKTS